MKGCFMNIYLDCELSPKNWTVHKGGCCCIDKERRGSNLRGLAKQKGKEFCLFVCKSNVNA